LQRTRDRRFDDHHRAQRRALRLGEREVGLDAGGVAVHHQTDGAGGREKHCGLEIGRTPTRFTESTASSHAAARTEAARGTRFFVDLRRLGPVHAQQRFQWLGVLGVSRANGPSEPAVRRSSRMRLTVIKASARGRRRAASES